MALKSGQRTRSKGPEVALKSGEMKQERRVERKCTEVNSRIKSQRFSLARSAWSFFLFLPPLVRPEVKKLSELLLKLALLGLLF